MAKVCSWRASTWSSTPSHQPPRRLTSRPAATAASAQKPPPLLRVLFPTFTIDDEERKTNRVVADDAVSQLNISRLDHAMEAMPRDFAQQVDAVRSQLADQTSAAEDSLHVLRDEMSKRADAADTSLKEHQSAVERQQGEASSRQKQARHSVAQASVSLVGVRC
jgi:hypothetical protein